MGGQPAAPPGVPSSTTLPLSLQPLDGAGVVPCHLAVLVQLALLGDGFVGLEILDSDGGGKQGGSDGAGGVRRQLAGDIEAPAGKFQMNGRIL